MKRRDFMAASGAVVTTMLSDSLHAAVPCPPGLDGTQQAPCPAGASSLADRAAALGLGESDLNVVDMRNPLAWNEFEISWCSILSFYDANRREIQYMTSPQSNRTSNDFNYAHYIYSEDNDSWRVTGYDLGNFLGHVYTCAFDPVNGDFFFLDWDANRIRRFDRASNTWTNTPANNNLPGGYSWSAGMVYHPNLFGAGDGGLIFCPTFDSNAQVWRRNTDSWSTLNGVRAANSPDDGGAQGIYIPGLDAAMIGTGFNAGSGSPTIYRVDAGSGGNTGSVSNLGNPGTPAIGWRNGPRAGHGKAIVDPNNDSRLLVLEFGGSSRVWASTNAGDTWSEVGNHPFSGMGGYSSQVSYVSIPAYGIILAMTSMASPPHRVAIWKSDV